MQKVDQDQQSKGIITDITQQTLRVEFQKDAPGSFFPN